MTLSTTQRSSVATNPARALRCEECRALATDAAEGWRGYLAYDPREDEAPYAVFYCALCAEREFGVITPRPYEDSG